MRGMTIATNLPRLRKAKGLSQAALAKKAGVSQQLVSRLESGVDLTSKKLPDLARALDVRVYDIDETYLVEAGPIEGEAAILAMLERIEGLKKTDIDVAFTVISNALQVNKAGSERSASGDRSEAATPRHESRPSPQR